MSPPPGPLEGPTSLPALWPSWNQDVAGWCIATLVVAAALVFLSGPLFAHDALKDDHGVCPEVPVAARATCLEHRGFTVLVGPVELALVLTLAAALVAGITDRRPVFRAAIVVASALLISVFVWFQPGQELASRYEVAGAATWLGVVAVLMSWPAWCTSQRVVIGSVAIVSCLLVVSDALSAY
jgi:hypothetical protein